MVVEKVIPFKEKPMKIGKLLLLSMVLGLGLVSGILATNIKNLKGMYACFGDDYKELSI